MGAFCGRSVLLTHHLPWGAGRGGELGEVEKGETRSKREKERRREGQRDRQKERENLFVNTDLL